MGITCLKIAISLLKLNHENQVSRQSTEDNRRMVNDVMFKCKWSCKQQKKALR